MAKGKRAPRARAQAKTFLAEIGIGESSPVSGIDAYVELLDEVLPDWDREWIQALDARATRWLRQLTTEWQPFSFTRDDPRFSDLDRETIARLTACGLVEQRLRCRATREGSLDCAEFTCVVTGSYDAKLLKTLAVASPDWREGISVTSDRAVEIRLTYEGEGAKADLQSGDAIRAAEVRIFTRGFSPLQHGENATEGTAVLHGEIAITQPFAMVTQKAARASKWKGLDAVILQFSETYGRWPNDVQDRQAVVSEYNQRFANKPGHGKATPKTVSQQVDTLKRKHGVS